MPDRAADRPDVGAPELRVRIDRDQGDLVLAVAGVGARHLNYMLDQARPLGGSADLADGGTPETGTIHGEDSMQVALAEDGALFREGL